jgi:hypothetical protein
MACQAGNTARYADAASISGSRIAEYHNLIPAKGDILFRRPPSPDIPLIYHAIVIFSMGIDGIRDWYLDVVPVLG